MEENKMTPNEETLTLDALLQDKALQAEFDRRVRKALETAHAKWDIQAQQQIAQARTEAETLARMSGEERIAHELNVRMAELDAREREIARRELHAEAVRLLAERKLPVELAEAMDYASAEAMKQSLDAVERAFRAAVQQGVEQRMRGDTPTASQHAAATVENDVDYYRSHYAN